ncbi:hypothetical protein H6P81_010111 [Aristolochia fimbriata]|uniref:Aminotransferase-like plant mobile domain-containing protein n=1 Tax=Aristolochia fimbriata TaxID=158543 RepID=A0AAV7EQP7_ARIFI|nr:hypothetical protein H6P81_010111 [Aristolochia fimbriata]
MAAPSMTLINGLHAFDHTVIVGDETVLTLALYMEGDASRLTYCPSGESVFGVMLPPSAIVNSSLPYGSLYGSLTRRLPIGDRVFFLACPDSPEKEDEAFGPETFALQSASCLVNRPPLPHIFEGGVIEQTLYTPGTALDTPIPFLFEWTAMLLGCCSRVLRSSGVYYGLWASLFQYNCDVSVVRAFLDAWSTETNTLVMCQGELSITLMDMDRIFGLHISGHFYDEVSPMKTMLFQSMIPGQALYGKNGAASRGQTTVERDVFDFLRVIPGKEDEVHSAALLSVWLSRFVFCSTGGDDLRPMVFKVANFIATGVRFDLVGPALACLYRGLGHAAAGASSMAQWPYLYSWLAVYFQTHGEDLDGIRRPCMISFGNPSLQRTFTEEQACVLFRCLPVPVWHRYILGANDLYALVDEPKKPIFRQHFESVHSVSCCSLTIRRSIHFFVEPYYPIRFARQFGYCRDLPGDLGARANQREAPSLLELVNLWKASFIRPCGRLDLPLSGGPTQDPGTTFAYYSWWREHVSPQFQRRLEPAPTVSTVVGSEEDEDYDSDRSHPRKRRPKGKKPIRASSENKKRAPLTTLTEASGSASRKKKARVEVQPTSLPSPPTFLPPISKVEPPVESSCPPLELNPPETVHISSSPEAPEAPQEESHPTSTVQIGSCVVAALEGTEVVEDLVEVAPSSTQLKTLPVQEVAPQVVQEAAEEATIEEEAPIPVLQEAAPAPSVEEVVEVGAVQEEASVVQEEAPTPVVEAPVSTIEEVAEVVREEIPAAVAVEEVAEVIPTVEEVAEVIPVVEEVAEVIPAVEEVAEVIPAVEEVAEVVPAVEVIESLAGEKASRTSRDWAESDAREALVALSSKLENAEITVDEAAEDLSVAKVDEEDSRERLELAREQLQLAETKVVYLTTQVEQIQESVRELKKAVVEAEQKVAEIIARPTLSAVEEATLLSLRADFAELQQEMARNL